MEPEKEEIIFRACKRRAHPCGVISGAVIDLFQVTDDKGKTMKHGEVFHSTRKEGIKFSAGCGMLRIDAASKINKREAKFLFAEMSERDKLEAMMIRGLQLKHIGILKSYMVSSNTQVSKMISAYNTFNDSLDVWLSKQPTKSRPSHLYSEEQEMIRTAYMAMVTLWEKGYTSDCLDDPKSYVMVDKRIKILLSSIRLKHGNELIHSMMILRKAFAHLVTVYILPIWKNAEMLDFADLLKNPSASDQDILEHPLLLTPARRELLYHKYDVDDLSDHQKSVLNRMIPTPENWQTSARKYDNALRSILKHQNQNIAFESNACGALHFASVVSSHYAEHLMKEYPTEWTKRIKDNTIDMLLNWLLPRVLTRRYGMSFDSRFHRRPVAAPGFGHAPGRPRQASRTVAL